MSLLLAGITVWFLVHLFPALAPNARENIVFKLGENPYKGIFSLLILVSLLMIVFGWKSAVPSAVYNPPLLPGVLPTALVLVGLVCFFAAQMNGHIKRLLRHPQMTGTILWASAHLLTNGDSRSVALFGGLGAWALLEILLTNRRDGPRGEAPQAHARQDLLAIVAGGVVFAIVGHFHLKLFGVAPL